MSQTQSATQSPTAVATWDPKRKGFETRWLFRLVQMLVIAITVVVIYWVVTQDIQAAPVRPLPAGADLAMVLAPVLAAAAGVERFLETIFGIIEGNWRTLVAYLGRGMSWLKNAEIEAESARQWMAQVSAEYARELRELPVFPTGSVADTGTTTAPAGASAGQPAAPAQEPQTLFSAVQERLKAAKELMGLAEQRLQAAEDQMSQIASSDSYRTAKRAVSIYLGLLLGLIVATVGSLQMFAMMGVAMGHPKVDVIITGLVIGGGSAPVHSLINILQSTKDTLDSAQDWLASRKKPEKEQGEQNLDKV